MIQDALLLRAFRGERTSKTPLWIMRQAGRYLPEYRALREKHTLLEMFRTAELAAEVTLQPLRRFPLDAAIIFADILTPLIGMGIEVDFKDDIGPVIGNPIKSAADVEKLQTPKARENVGYTLRAIEMVTKEFTPKGIPLIGFSGAPYTLSYYLIENERRGKVPRAKEFMLSEPQAWRRLQEKLVTLISEYLIAQVAAGATALQLFDSWVGELAPQEFEREVLPSLKEIISRVRAATNVPVVYFAPHASGILPLLSQVGAQVIGVDWRVSLGMANTLLGGTLPLQGNLDPVLLYGPSALLRDSVHAILKEGSTLPAHIFNLGHGILPTTPLERVEEMVALVKAYER